MEGFTLELRVRVSSETTLPPARVVAHISPRLLTVRSLGIPPNLEEESIWARCTIQL